VLLALVFASCEDVLDIQPVDRVTSTQLFADELGLEMVLATLYNRIPIEDFNYVSSGTMNITGTAQNVINADGGWNLGGSYRRDGNTD
jgi:starch-binding outer membrane protein, SusD/RagB family